MKLNEIIIIPSSDFEGSSEDLMPDDDQEHEEVLEAYKDSVKLPGGSDYTWTYFQNPNALEVYIFDPNMDIRISYDKDLPIIGKFVLERNFNEKYLSVSAVSVHEKYRGKKIGLSLYGLVLATLGKPIISDSTQTIDGAKMWVKIASVPGVKIEALYRGLYKNLDDRSLESFKRNLTLKGLKIFEDILKNNKDKSVEQNIQSFFKDVGGDLFEDDSTKYKFEVQITNQKISNQFFDLYKSQSFVLIATKS